ASSLALWKRERWGCLSFAMPPQLAARAALAKSAAETVAAHVEVEMIVMGGVIVGAEHRPKAPACRFVQRAQKVLRRPVALPPAAEHEPPPVGKHEARDVDRVRIGVLRQPPRPAAIDVAAAVGAIGLDLHDLGP